MPGHFLIQRTRQHAPTNRAPAHPFLDGKRDGTQALVKEKNNGRLDCLFHAAHLTRLHLLPERLHELVRLHVRLEELGGAAVKTDGLALVDLALAVVLGDALLGADLGKARRLLVSCTLEMFSF